jgi:GlpG protein
VPSEQFADARSWLDTIRAHPERLNQVAWQGSQARDGQSLRLQDLTRGLQRFGWATLLILALCVLVYLSQFVVGDSLYRALLFPVQLGRLVDSPWRLITPALLHFSILHITFNLIWWLDLGGAIERLQSSWRLLGLALVVAAVSNLAQFLASGPLFGGLSGVVYGLLGYVWLWGRWRPGEGLSVSTSIALLMVGWLLLCWTGLLGPVANIAHLAGLATGLLLTGIWLSLTRRVGAGAD